MGLRTRKSVSAGPLRVNLSKSGVGYSVGTKGFRYTKKAGGGTRTTTSIPGTGVSYVKETGKHKSTSTRTQYSPKYAGTNNGNDGQRKVARVLALIVGIPTCIFAVIALLCGEFAIFAIFGAIGALFLFMAKKFEARQTPADKAVFTEVEPRTTAPSPRKKNTLEPDVSGLTEIRTTQDVSNSNKSDPMEVREESAAYTEKTYRVAGITYHTDSVMNLATENSCYDFTKKELIDEDMTGERIWQYEFDPTDVKLIPEPDNPEDPHAIKVVVDGEHIGYIKSGSCAHIHKLLKQNHIIGISCEIGGGPYKYISEEYDEDKDRDIYTLERDKTNFFAVLKIQESQDK